MPTLSSQFQRLVQAFQKLIYVSTIVFGERRAAFLLPWRRIFNLTDAQLSVAKRDNAKALFNNHIQSLGGELQVCLALGDYLAFGACCARLLGCLPSPW